MARLLVGEFKMKMVGYALSFFWAAIALSTLAGPAYAISFTGTFNITSDAAVDPSLVIVTNPTLGTNSSPFSFDLTPGSPTATISNLFKIGTPESALNLSDDFANKNITVTFNFTAPPPAFGGPMTGETHGSLIFIPPFFILPGGKVEWDDPIVLGFGNGGQLGIQLFDTDFLLAHDGHVRYSDVKAEFTLLVAPREEVPGTTPVPGAIWLLGSALAGAAGLDKWRRKRRKLST
jgi:hypothetical protein